MPINARGPSVADLQRTVEEYHAYIVQLEEIRARHEALRPALSTWLTLALDSSVESVRDVDLSRLRNWIDAGCAGEPPWPGT